MNKKITVSVIAFFFIVAIAYAYNVFPSVMEKIKNDAEIQARDFVNGDVEIGEIAVTKFNRINISKINISTTNRQEVVYIPEMEVTIDVWQALTASEPAKAVSAVEIKNVVVNLEMNTDKVWNTEKLLKPTDGTESFFMGVIKIKDGQANIKTPYGSWTTNLAGSIDSRSNPKYALDLSVSHKGEEIKIKGLIDNKTNGKIVITSDKVSLDEFALLTQELLPATITGGVANKLQLIWENNQGKYNLNGDAFLQEVTGETVHEEQTLPFTITGKTSVVDKQLTLKKVRAMIAKQELEIDGAVDFSTEEISLLAIQLKANDFDLSKVWRTSPWQGGVQLQAKLNGPISELEASGVLFAKTGLYKDYPEYPITDLQISFDLQKKILLIPEIKAKVLSGEISGNISYDLATDKVSGAMSTKEIDVAKIEAIPELQGKINADIILDGVFSENNGRVNGTVEIPRLIYRGMTLYNVLSTFSFDDQIFMLKDCTAEFLPVGKVLLNLTVHNDKSLQGNLEGAMLPLAELFKPVNIEATGQTSLRANILGNLSNPQIDLKMYSDGGAIMRQPFDSIDTNIIFADNKIAIKNMDIKTTGIMSLPGGTHSLLGTFDLNSKELDMFIKSKQVRIDYLTQYLLDPKDKLTGFIDNTTQIRGRLNKLVISGDMRMYDGSYNKNIINEIKGQYTYNQGTIALKNFLITALNASLRVQGEISQDGEMNFDLNATKLDLKRIPIDTDTKLEGQINFVGKVMGKISRPLFAGELLSDNILINGQPFEAFAGKLSISENRDVKMVFDFNQGAGEFSFAGGFNYDSFYPYGRLVVAKGDVKSLLSAMDYDLPINGVLDGRIDLNKSGKGSGLIAGGTIFAGKIRDIPMDKITFNAIMLRDKIILNNFYGEQGKGHIKAKGSAVYAGDIDLEIAGNDVDAGILTAFMEDPINLTGDMNFLAQLTGSIKQPMVSASMAVNNGTLVNVSFDEFYALASMNDNETITINNFILSKDEDKVSAYGTVPLDIFRAVAARINPNSEMNVTLNLERGNLSILPALSDLIEWGVGNTTGKVVISGDSFTPLINGKFSVTDGAIKFRNVYTPLENLQIVANFNGDNVTLENLSANMGIGSLNGRGNVFFYEQDSSPYSLILDLVNIPTDSEISKGPLNAKFSIEQDSRRNRPKIKGDIFLDNIVLDIIKVPELGESSGINIGMDIAVKSGENFRMYNKYLYDIWLDADLSIKGSTLYPNIEGRVKVVKGTLDYLRTKFKIEEGFLSFPIRGSFMPSVLLTAKTRLLRTNIDMTVKGAVDKLDIKLTSDPNMTQEQIFKLLTLKTDPTKQSNSASDDARALLQAGLQMGVFNQVESVVRTGLGLDEFKLYQGELTSGVDLGRRNTVEDSRSEKNNYNFLVGKYITKNVLLGYTATFDNSHYNIYVQYEVTPKITFSANLDEQNKQRYGIEYRTKF